MPSDPIPTSPEVLVPTPASAWGQKNVEEGFLTELPSGNVARIKRSMNMLNLLREGRIPNPLASIVKDMVQSKVQDIPEDMQTIEVIQQFGEMLDDIAIESMIEPPLDRPEKRGRVTVNGVFTNPEETEEEYLARIEMWVPREGYVSVWALDVNDKMFLFTIAQGGAADAKQFREVQAEPVEPVANVKKSPKPTKRTGGPGGRPKAQ